jgi:putative hydrolase of the HAD superfamily
MAGLKRAGIIFDFDDTLIYSHEQFLLAEEVFVTRMKELGLFDEDLLSAVRARDIANVRRAGYMAAECFPLALAQTYESYCGKYGRKLDVSEKLLLLQLGWQPYKSPPREMAGARKLLKYLRPPEGGKRPLILFTQGEQEIQQQRLNLCNMADMFDAIKVVREKNDAALRALLEEQQLEPALTWYVGNSLRADINPAIRAGLKAVHLITAGWSYEEAEPCGFYRSISHLEQFAALLQQEEVAR